MRLSRSTISLSRIAIDASQHAVRPGRLSALSSRNYVVNREFFAIPHEVWIAIPRNSEPPRSEFPPVRISRLSDAAYSIGIEGHEIDGVTVRIYSPEKTLVDCFSRRNDVGLDVALEAMKSYVSRRKVNVDLIMEYASKLRCTKAIRPYLEALL